ncbi:hypothetical protein AAVH_40769, partial [Aphelenchoides avenae]
STSVSPSTSSAKPSTSAGSTKPATKSTTKAVPSTTKKPAASTTKKPAGAKCLKYLTGVCKNVSPKESEKCNAACKKQGFSYGICAKLVPSSGFGAILCVCK